MTTGRTILAGAALVPLVVLLMIGLESLADWATKNPRLDAIPDSVIWVVCFSPILAGYGAFLGWFAGAWGR